MKLLGEKHWPIKTIVTDPTNGEEILCTFICIDHMLETINQWHMTFGGGVDIKIKSCGHLDN